MKFNINKDAIFKGLQSIQSIVDRKNTMPILSNVMLECSDDVLNLFATDLEVSIQRSISVRSDDRGRTTAPARKLFEIVRELPEDEVIISGDEDYNIKVECDDIVFRLKGLPSEEFPSFPDYDESQFIEIDSKMLQEMIDKTHYSISPEDIQYTLSGMYVEKILEQTTTYMRFVATDGHRLALIDRPADVPFLGDEGIIIPRKGISEMRKIIQDVGEKIALTLNSNQLILKRNDVTLFVRLIDGVFPDYKEVIPEANPKTIPLNRLKFLNSLRRASIVSMEKFRGVKFEFSSGTLTISSNNPDVGESEEKLPIEYEDESMSVAFNAKYFTEALNALECENILLQLDDESSPAIVKDEDDDKFVAVVMPMRV
jgi:DNA polymerase-3 subunit beta